MKRFLKILTRYKFFIVLLLMNMALLFIAPEVGEKSLSLSINGLVEMLSIIPPIFILLGLMDVWIPKETMMKYMGKGAGITGVVFALLLGSFSAGPLYAAFPVAAVFLKKGVSLTNVFIFIGAWSTTKIPMMLFEITQLGAKFAVSRFVLNLIGIFLLAFVINRTTSGGEYEKIQRSACSQLGK